MIRNAVNDTGYNPEGYLKFLFHETDYYSALLTDAFKKVLGDTLTPEKGEFFTNFKMLLNERSEDQKRFILRLFEEFIDNTKVAPDLTMLNIILHDFADGNLKVYFYDTFMGDMNAVSSADPDITMGYFYIFSKRIPREIIPFCDMKSLGMYNTREGEFKHLKTVTGKKALIFMTPYVKDTYFIEETLPEKVYVLIKWEDGELIVHPRNFITKRDAADEMLSDIGNFIKRYPDDKPNIVYGEMSADISDFLGKNIIWVIKEADAKKPFITLYCDRYVDLPYPDIKLNSFVSELKRDEDKRRRCDEILIRKPDSKVTEDEHRVTLKTRDNLYMILTGKL